MVMGNIESFFAQEFDRHGIDGVRIDAGAAEDKLRLVQRIGNRLGHLAAAGVTDVHKQDPQHLCSLVLGIFTRAHVEHPLRRYFGLIGDPFETPGNRQERGERLQRNFAELILLHQGRIDAVAQRSASSSMVMVLRAKSAF